MARTKYYYDQESCKYEKVIKTKWDLLFNLLGFFSTSLVVAITFFLTYHKFFDSPTEILLRNENSALKTHFGILKQDMIQIENKLRDLQDKDANLYRAVLGAEPLSESELAAGTGGVNRYEKLKDADKELVIMNSFRKLDKLQSLLKIQSQSYKQIIKKCNQRSHRLSCIPAILPIKDDELKRIGSGYGHRFHPVYRCRKMHNGQDFACRKGTRVVATGNGVVKKAYYSNTSGNIIYIDHGYGIQSMYCHLSKIKVKRGQHVTRGQEIAESGNTGKSTTAPHLHYSIYKNGKSENPVHYFFKDVSPQRYNRLKKLAARDIQSMD